MDDQIVRNALKSQYHGALKSLKEAISACPQELWVRESAFGSFWATVYHTLYFTHCYLGQTNKSMVRWHKHRRAVAELRVEGETPYTIEEMLEYWEIVDSKVAPIVDGLDLATPASGFSWYKIPKLDHQILNIRHTMNHVGQLDSLLREHGVKPINWH